MAKTNFFANITSLEALKKEYKRLARINHPDMGGILADMQTINSEFDRLFKAFQGQAVAPAAETADTFRSEFYTANGWKGDKYDGVKHMPTAAISKLIRGDLKNEFPECKFSVTTSLASMCAKIHVAIMAGPYPAYMTAEEFAAIVENRDGYSKFREECRQTVGVSQRINKCEYCMTNNAAGIYNKTEDRDATPDEIAEFLKLKKIPSEKMAAILERVDAIVKAYNFDDCDSMIDYFDVNFYYDGCKIGKAWDKEYIFDASLMKKAKQKAVETTATTEMTAETTPGGGVSADLDGVNVEIISDVDTRNGEAITVVKLVDSLDREEYKRVSGIMKAHGGYYSRFKSGFIFKSFPSALFPSEPDHDPDNTPGGGMPEILETSESTAPAESAEPAPAPEESGEDGGEASDLATEETAGEGVTVPCSDDEQPTDSGITPPIQSLAARPIDWAEEVKSRINAFLPEVSTVAEVEGLPPELVSAVQGLPCLQIVIKIVSGSIPLYDSIGGISSLFAVTVDLIKSLAESVTATRAAAVIRVYPDNYVYIPPTPEPPHPDGGGRAEGDHTEPATAPEPERVSPSPAPSERLETAPEPKKSPSGNEGEGIIIPELPAVLIERANANSMSGERGSQSRRSYAAYCEEVTGWDISAGKKQRIIDKVYKKYLPILTAEAKHVSVMVAGPARYNAKRLDHGDEVLKNSHDFCEWFDELRRTAGSVRKGGEKESEKLRLMDDIRRYWDNPQAVGVVDYSGLCRHKLEKLATLDTAAFMQMYEEADHHYKFKRSTTVYKLYQGAKSGKIKPTQAENIFTDENLTAFKEGGRVYIKFYTRPQRQLMTALKSRGYWWNSGRSAWSTYAEKLDVAWIEIISERYERYI